MKVTHGVDQKEMMVALKLHGILASSLLLIGLMVMGLGMYIYYNMTNFHHSFSAMMISNTLKCSEIQKEIKIDWTIIKKFLKILSALLIILSIVFFTLLGCFLVLNDTAVQTVTLSSEGAAKETYPDSFGEYQLAEEDIGGYNWYRHKDREDRFLMYNNLGNTEY